MTVMYYDRKDWFTSKTAVTENGCQESVGFKVPDINKILYMILNTKFGRSGIDKDY